MNIQVRWLARYEITEIRPSNYRDIYHIKNEKISDFTYPEDIAINVR